MPYVLTPRRLPRLTQRRGLRRKDSAKGLL